MKGVTTYQLSAGQRWLAHLVQEESQLARPVQRIYRFAENFDSAAFLQAVNEVVRAHQALRLRLIEEGNEFRQSFKSIEPKISGEAITGRTPEARAAYASILISREAEQVMDLRQESPVRAKVIRVDDELLLSLCIDHIAADETAFSLIELELQATYETIICRKTIINECDYSFSNYLSNEAVRRNIERASLTYWQKELENAPLNYKEVGVMKWVPAIQCSFEIDGTSLKAILDGCRLNRCSLFHVMIAAQLNIMTNAADLDDLVINVPVSNRISPQDKTMVANLSMLLHVRFAGIGSHQGTELFSWVRDTFLKAMVHRQYDYPSLSRFMAQKANEKGGQVNWVNGCNFIVEDMPMVYPNSLFAERLDNQPGRSCDIPAMSFNFTARQHKLGLHVDAEWDKKTWTVDVDDFKNMFYGALDWLRPVNNLKKQD